MKAAWDLSKNQERMWVHNRPAPPPPRPPFHGDGDLKPFADRKQTRVSGSNSRFVVDSSIQHVHAID